MGMIAVCTVWIKNMHRLLAMTQLLRPAAGPGQLAQAKQPRLAIPSHQSPPGPSQSGSALNVDIIDIDILGSGSESDLAPSGQEPTELRTDVELGAPSSNCQSSQVFVPLLADLEGIVTKEFAKPSEAHRWSGLCRRLARVHGKERIGCGPAPPMDQALGAFLSPSKTSPGSTLLVKLMKEQATAMGRATASFWVARRHLWLSQSQLSGEDRTCLLQLPIVPSAMFGPNASDAGQAQEARRCAREASTILRQSRGAQYSRGSRGSAQRAPSIAPDDLGSS
ncbi:hypothetical protein WMY93_020386 [Mugilogobius chulae]|uniref:Uncharacterized protein n=1 Tax=Mugilogobius chulae TaxID=88201 RepID=A0AAW0NI24_9GOBI